MASSLKKLKSLILSECPIMEKIFQTQGNSVEKECVFPKLEEIHLRKMNKLKDIWQTKVSIDSFSSLISVNIEECNKLDKIFSSHMEGWVENLEKLKVSKCQSVEVIFGINESQEIDAFGGIDTNLQVILLEDLPKLKNLWSTDPDGILNFKKLRTMEVSSCDELRNLLPTSVAKDVSNLERMSALYCDNMVEIVVSQDALKANNDVLVFSELICVRLCLLPNIKHFYKGKYPIKCPKLKELSVNNCGKLKTFLKEVNKPTNEEENFVFSAKEVLPNLEYMEIDFNQAQNLLPEYQTHCLKELSLISVQSVDLLHQFPYRMPNLEKLNFTVSALEESMLRANISRQKRLGMVLQLKQLCLFSSEIMDLGFEQDQVLQRLEVLRLESCNNLTNFAPPSVSFTYLTHLELKYCSGLKNLMASSTAKSMVQLKTMKVIDCGNIEQIVSNEGSEEGKVMKIVLGKLISIELVGLDNMRSFCSYKDYEFEFPSLEILIVRECPNMEKFSEREPITPKLKDIFGVEGDEKAKWHWEGDLNGTIQRVFNDKVTFTYTEYLSVGSNKFIELLWHGRHGMQQNSFGYLKKLDAWECDTLVHIIPSHLLSCLHNLEELDVHNCSEVKVIFNINDENRVTKASGIFRLKRLFLTCLPKLEHVWEKDPEGIIGLQALEEVRVSNCECLQSLFPSLGAKDLTRLQVLQVTGCNELTEIFRKDEKDGEGTTQHSVFPPLTSLSLHRFSCNQQQENISNLSMRDIQLCLGSRPIPNSCFDLLESLTLDGYQFLSDVLLPFNLLPFLTSLETLEVRNCDSVKGIFDVKCTTHGEDVTMGQILSFSLKKLSVSNLPNLKNVWSKDPHGILSMRHLREVHVKECKSLTSVFPSSVAKDLVKLEDLSVEDCKGLMTIVAEDNTDPSLELTFPCLYVRSLKLRGLSKLKYFYYCSLKSDIYTFLESHTECLSLGENGVKMILRGEFQRNLLDNLKALTLCLGSDVFPYEILEQIPNVDKLVVCDGSFKEMLCCESGNNVLHQLKVLQLESLEELVSIGLENPWTESFVKNLETFEVMRCSSLKSLVACGVCFSNLACLKVKDCDRLSYLFTSSTAKSLLQLKRMEIIDCHSIEEIVSKEESDENEIIFPQLSCLNLEDLWILQRFYKGNLSFPSLRELSVKSCFKMVTLCAGTLEAGKLSQVTIDYGETILLETDFNSTMQKKYLIESPALDLKSSPGLQEIWHGSLHISDFCFGKLVELIVEECQFLLHAVLPFLLLSLLPKLETLEVRNCDFVKTIFDVKCRTQDTLITFPLKKLVLSKLPKLENVWNEDPHGILNMHHLKEVYVKECKGLTNVFPASVAKDLVKLENLAVEYREGLMTIVAEDNTDPGLEFTFPRSYVVSLKLQGLPKFKYFYYWSHKSDIYTNPESLTEDQLRSEKCMSVGENGKKMILRGEIPRNFLDNLKILTLCFGSDVFPYEILEQIPNIEKLVVCDGSFKEMFCWESGNNVLQQLKVLQLEYLGELVSIGLQNSWTDSFVRNLETFEVISCEKLKNLVPCTVSFSNLMYLGVEGCHSLSYLFTSSTAKRLGKLKRMEIIDCGSLKEIVCKEESDEDKIIFPQLSCLNLEDLKNLRRFYVGSLSFPSLEELSVTDCDEMITLCVGTLVTGKLSQVKLEQGSEAIQLEIDLKSTMRKEFLKERAQFPN